MSAFCCRRTLCRRLVASDVRNEPNAPTLASGQCLAWGETCCIVLQLVRMPPHDAVR
jgi:hypothetical protein